MVDGQPTTVTIEPKPQEDGLNISGEDWAMTLDGLGPDNQPLNLGPNGVLVLDAERDVRTTGEGFQPNSDVALFIEPPVTAADSGAFATSGVPMRTEPISIGTVRVGPDGTFDGIRTLPDGLKPGQRTLQAVGFGPAGERRALSLGIVVRAWIILDQGRRSVDARHDRVRTTGTTGGIEAGARLAPLIKYVGRDTFIPGVANIVVADDGSFKWTRQIRKGKGVTGYVTYDGIPSMGEIASNRVFWGKLKGLPR